MSPLPKYAARVVLLMSLLAFLLSTGAEGTSNPSQDGTKSYIVHMDSAKVAALDRSLAGAKRWHEAVFDALLELSSEAAVAAPELLYVYETALTGFAAKLSAIQLATLRKMDGFLSAYPDDMSNTIHTTHSPQFLGLKPSTGLWSPANLASDVIIGIVDTGIWPEHASFSDDDHLSGTPRKWKGTCAGGTRFSPRDCNKKLIGARAFYNGYEALAGRINETAEFRSARDSQGHGTHTASTAAGNVISGASLFGNAKGTAKGMMYTARIAVYKACWSQGCVSSDILAAADRAVGDGVDVLSLSLGGGSRPYFTDPIAIAAFGAVHKGVLVSCSAGNSGPAESTVSNSAPWIMTVAASYLDRSFPTVVKLGDGRTFKGASLYSGGATRRLPVVYADAAGKPGARYCADGTLSPKLVRGKIVVCDRGINSRTEKGVLVKRAGGAGALLLNSAEQGEELFADAHVLPASSLGAAAATAVRKYVATWKKPTASIAFLGTVYGSQAPMMALFSSRGPSSVGPDVIKPDVTAPGMSILAAWPPSVVPSLLQSDLRKASFNIISGTSMSCPHVSGLAALLKSAHRDWSPAAIKSALMTTAYTVDNRNASIVDVSSGLPATPFAYGSGHVDPERASNPGLIYDITPKDYLNYLCSLNYTSLQLSIMARKSYSCPKGRLLQAGDLNYPSFSVPFDVGRPNATVTYTRTVTNVGRTQCRYTVSVVEPERVSMSVAPQVLAFRKKKQRLRYRVTFVGLGGSGSSFGELIWVCGEFRVRSPVAVTWQ